MKPRKKHLRVEVDRLKRASESYRVDWERADDAAERSHSDLVDRTRLLTDLQDRIRGLLGDGGMGLSTADQLKLIGRRLHDLWAIENLLTEADFVARAGFLPVRKPDWAQGETDWCLHVDGACALIKGHGELYGSPHYYRRLI